MTDPRARRLAAVRAKIAALEGAGSARRGTLPFGAPEIDDCFPEGGLPLGRWHEIAGEGMDAEVSAAPAAFAALLAAPLLRRGHGVWILRRDDLYAPGLAGLGLAAERMIAVSVRDTTEALGVMEEALCAAGVSVVIAEAETVDLAVGRRLQLACERGGATGFVLRRTPYGGGSSRPQKAAAAATRWRVRAAPSAPAPLGLGSPRWEVSLERCRGGRTGAWLLEASRIFTWEARDDAHPLRLVAGLGARELAPAPSIRRSA